MFRDSMDFLVSDVNFFGVVLSGDGIKVFVLILFYLRELEN